MIRDIYEYGEIKESQGKTGECKELFDWGPLVYCCNLLHPAHENIYLRVINTIKVKKIASKLLLQKELLSWLEEVLSEQFFNSLLKFWLAEHK